MALTNFPQAPTVSSIYSFQNSAPQLSEATANNTRALQNAFSFGTKLIDFLKSQDQANLMKSDSADKDALLQSIKDDQAKLAQLKNELASLKGGV